MNDKNIPNLDDLFEDLNHPNPNINCNAFKAMHAFWPNESKHRLIGNLNSQNIELRRKSVKALASFGKDIVKPVLEVYLSTKDRVLHISCLKVLVQIAAHNNLDDYYEDINHVIDLAIHDYSVEITLSLINLLRQIGGKGISTLTEIAKDKDILRSRAAITALSEISEPKARLYLKDLSKQSDIDPIIREAIDIGLGEK